MPTLKWVVIKETNNATDVKELLIAQKLLDRQRIRRQTSHS
ncbi:unnamed protein product [Acidithrix sp. C25]|nr:unnamed protein product [Acidithrix sp. C25]